MRGFRRGAALVTAALLSVSPIASAQVLEDDPGFDTFGDGYGYSPGFTDGDFGNDWFYDDYEAGLENDWATGTGWYDDPAYAGTYDDDFGEDDWFYDSYDDVGDEGLFDV